MLKFQLYKICCHGFADKHNTVTLQTYTCNCLCKIIKHNYYLSSVSSGSVWCDLVFLMNNSSVTILVNLAAWSTMGSQHKMVTNRVSVGKMYQRYLIISTHKLNQAQKRLNHAWQVTTNTVKVNRQDTVAVTILWSTQSQQDQLWY